MRVSEKTIVIDQKKLTYTHIENNSHIVCYMLSGAGYTYEKPLLYYSTMLLLEKKFDVVHVHYSYEKELFNQPFADISELIYSDVSEVIADVEKQFMYEEIFFLGKSLGTIPIIMKLMNGKSKHVLLTPLLKLDEIHEALLASDHSALLVIGEEDPHFVPTKVEQLRNKANLIVVTVPKANHSLDIQPFKSLESVESLKEIIGNIETFING
ncbi:alpha/beta hydrolase [Anaerobacillus alkaliphilus]|uniref:Alpha/beta hydrolase n=1 Tax=Anaerobacillus alkaliphilus TaxID=1548597 RepID=A0A4Q0VS97_9BACI|nr:alpha/beta hydrolase [Anaerobacillus alkaliphilus]RXJ00669.1 alpha/beta hydrolase [Anaerobacillus alkaliphilus]